MITKDLKKIIDEAKTISGLDFYLKYNDIEIFTNEFSDGLKDIDNNLYLGVNDDSEIAKVTLALLKSHILTYLSTNNYDFDTYFQKIIDKDLNDKEIKEYSDNLNFNHKDKILYLLCSNKLDEDIYKALVNLLNENDYITYYGGYIFIIKEENEMQFGKLLIDITESEFMINAEIAYSNVFDDMTLVNKAYKECVETLEIGRLYPNKSKLYAYNANKLAKFIYHLPKETIEDFLKSYDIKNLNNEDYITINALLAANLNVAQASRNLYIHRNTLIYRIEKINKELGLNIQNFDDALIIKLLMLMKDKKM